MPTIKKRKINKTKRNYWKEEEENLLKKWSDKAQCYMWMHNRSREIYQRRNAFYTIPVIIISTITGTANFAQDRFSEDIKEYVVMSIGSLSIIAGIITTIYQFLKISELNEGHRVASLSWGKFHRNIESELTRHPLDRTDASELIKISKEEYNRLVEISPFIPKKVLKEFNKKFRKNKNLTKPEIGNVIKTMDIFTMNKDERQKMIDELNENVNLKNSNILKKEDKINSNLEKFKSSFYSLNNRFPTQQEIKKNMKFIHDNSSDSENSIDLEKGYQDENLKLDILDEEEDNGEGADNEDIEEDNEEDNGEDNEEDNGEDIDENNGEDIEENNGEDNIEDNGEDNGEEDGGEDGGEDEEETQSNSSNRESIV